jgi:LacI family transcriptional regulator
VIIPEDTGALGELHRIPLDGVILLSEEISPDIILKLNSLGLALVMCGALSLSRSFSAVHVDDLAAAYDGTNYLLDLGHRKIGLIAHSPFSISSGFQRIAGCRKAMEDRGLVLLDHLVISEGCDYEKGYRGAQTLLEREPELSAIFAHSDAAALGVMSALEDRGIKVPGDVSVLGFDDTGAGERSRPRLSSVRQPIPDIVAKSLELLIHDIEHPAAKNRESVILPHTITRRESCREI